MTYFADLRKLDEDNFHLDRGQCLELLLENKKYIHNVLCATFPHGSRWHDHHNNNIDQT